MYSNYILISTDLYLSRNGRLYGRLFARVSLALLLGTLLSACHVFTADQCASADPLCNPVASTLLTAATADAGDPGFTCRGSGNGGNYWNVFGTAGADGIVAVCGLDNGEFLVLGSSTHQLTGVTVLNSHANPGASNNLYLARIATTGAMSWVTYFGDTAGNTAANITRTGENRFALSGRGPAISSMQGLTPVSAGSAGNDHYVLSVDGNGTLQWFTNLGSTGTDSQGALAYDEIDDSLYMAGTSTASITDIDGMAPIDAGLGSSECGVFRLEASTGNLVWYTHLTSTLGDGCRSIALGIHGGPVVVGNADGTSMNGATPINSHAGGGNSDIFITMLEPDGRIRWLTFFGGTDIEDSPRIARLPNYDFVVAGEAYDNIASIGSLTPIVPFAGGTGLIDVVSMGYSAAGELQFYTYHGINADDDGLGGIMAMPDGGYATNTFISQTMSSFDGKTPVMSQTDGTEDAIFRYDPAGNLIWYTFYGASTGPVGTGLTDGGFFVAGNIDANSATSVNGVAPLNAYSSGGSDAGYFRINSSGLLQQ